MTGCLTLASSRALEKGRVRQPLLTLFPFVGDPRECRGDVAFPPSFGAPEKAQLRQPLLILFPYVGDP